MRILLIKQTSLGDVLHSTAQVRAIRRAFPNCRITFLTSTTAYDIYRYSPHINKIILFDRYSVKKNWLYHPIQTIKHIFNTIQEVRLEEYDLAIDLQGRWKTIIFLWSARATRRLVKGRWWFVENFHNPSMHALEEMNGLIQSAGLGLGGFEMEFFTSKQEKSQVDQIVNENDLDDHRWILCCPISRWPTKNWPLEKFVLLSEKLSPDIRLIFTGDSADKEFISSGLMGIDEDRVVNLAGSLTLPEFSEFVSRAPVIVTMDSFALHVAATHDRPTVALFGPTDESKVGPTNNKTIFVRAKQMNCSRCYRRTNCSKFCIREILPDEVYEALQRATHNLY
ncbi:MAG: hypothetical protein CL402_02270 [Acidiferrobacteraceae bacterium]|nr:hypothetical protein [Acidiferrobacteraceae bacterium]|tara:strand:+ start:62355 stop:63368 length:1014 start_codon:yes stop_codon:yes gene_type:complete